MEVGIKMRGFNQTQHHQDRDHNLMMMMSISIRKNVLWIVRIKSMIDFMGKGVAQVEQRLTSGW
ncbi:hypothetical protein PsorP6_001847 [Peronosclerospora sorghi]|uniref:Uncharacterized protein n=1 Tax=Peronosclerospora sorghi TaxID=230839 RepID=A0ACC0WRD3_9STRA|nr:hypothetical protein PsorP6_001847 [Peronosclerospora sorghi]